MHPSVVVSSAIQQPTTISKERPSAPIIFVSIVLKSLKWWPLKTNLVVRHLIAKCVSTIVRTNLRTRLNLFSTLKPQNPPIDEFYVVQKLRPWDFEDQSYEMYCQLECVFVYFNDMKSAEKIFQRLILPLIKVNVTLASFESRSFYFLHSW